jgi:F-type H+-transporting ATPase subunit epsilon
MATSGKQLQCVIVTPEKAVVDEAADMVILPMIDGELGVQPGRAAVIGQLGKGELRLKLGAETKRWQITGGFAQVRNDVITVLTTKATG